LSQMGFRPFDFPFLDMHGILATAECHRRGIDVITSNPCDILGRTLDYSPFWLVTASFGVDTSMTMKLGLMLDLVFLGAVFFLPPARSWGAVAVMIAALLSSAVAMALERANLDLAVFVIAVLAAGWLLRGPAWRSLSYGLITLAALIKYYPAIMLLLAWRERRRFLLLLAAALIAVAGLFLWLDGAMLMRALGNIDTRQFPTTFSAINLPQGLAQLVAPGAEFLARIVELVFASLAAAYGVIIARRGEIRGALQSLPARDRNLMLIGCTLILGCFFTAENAPYRNIYFLFILPGLADMGRNAATAAARRRLKLLTGAILFLMWSPFFRLALEQSAAGFGLGTIYSDAYLLLRETIWWWVISILLALVFDVFLAARAGDSARRPSRDEIEGEAVTIADLAGG
jgi:alkylhydroperoxidase/carboxymuconolactone decarboxylase family protein YurZ